MKQILQLLVLQLICCSLITAQTIELNLLAGRVAHKDNLIQPLVYTGNSLGLQFQYKKNTKATILMTQFTFLEKLDLYNSLNNNVDQFNANLSFSYLKRVKINLPKGKLYLGGTFETNYNMTLGYSISQDFFRWLTQYNLQFTTAFQVSINEKSYFETMLSVPIVGLYSRPDKFRLYEYKRETGKFYFHDGLKIQTANHVKALQFNLNYHYQFKEKWGLKLGYQFYYLSYDVPVSLQFMHHHIMVGITKKLL